MEAKIIDVFHKFNVLLRLSIPYPLQPISSKLQDNNAIIGIAKKVILFKAWSEGIDNTNWFDDDPNNSEIVIANKTMQGISNRTIGIKLILIHFKLNLCKKSFHISLFFDLKNSINAEIVGPIHT